MGGPPNYTFHQLHGWRKCLLLLLVCNLTGFKILAKILAYFAGPKLFLFTILLNYRISFIDTQFSCFAHIAAAFFRFLDIYIR
jgi:hypothetical protein